MTTNLIGQLQEALSLSIVHSLWQGILLYVLVILAGSLLGYRSSNKRYWLFFAALLLQFSAFTGTFLWLLTDGSSASSSAASGFAMNWKEGVFFPQSVSSATGLESVYFQVEQIFRYAQSYSQYISLAWLVGAFLLGFRFFSGLVYIRKVRLSGFVPEGKWIALLHKVGLQMGLEKLPELLESARVEVPTLIGWLKPVILMPVGMMTQLSPAEVEAILAHELAHFKRHDYLMNLLQSVAEMVLFFHPVTWWLGQHIAAEREFCCDDAVVHYTGKPSIYARALANLAVASPMLSRSLSLRATGNPGSILTRINRIMKTNQQPEKEGRAAFWLSTLFATTHISGKGMGAMITILTASVALIGSSFTQVEPPVSAQKQEIIEIPPKEMVAVEPQEIVELVPVEIKESTVSSTSEEPEIVEERPFGEIVEVEPTEIEKQEILEVTFPGQKTEVENGKEPLYMINGKKASPSEIQKLDPKLVLQIDVIKGEAAIEKYGEKGRDGVVEITLREDVINIPPPPPMPQGEVKEMFGGYTVDPLFIVDGKKVYSSEELNQMITPDHIEKVEVIKGKKAEELYQEEGKNGVVVITLKDSWFKVPPPPEKKGEETGSSEMDKSKPLFVLDGEFLTSEVEIGNQVSPNEIDQIVVLKGKKAIEKYGEKGSNGVVEITTKKEAKKKKKLKKKKENSSKELLAKKPAVEKKEVLDAKNLLAFPNPSNGLFHLNFRMESEGQAKVSAYDLTGKQVAIISEGKLEAGVHSFTWDASEQEKGMYLILVELAHKSFQTKVVVE